MQMRFSVLLLNKKIKKMFWPVFHVNLAPSILVLLLCDISKIPVLIAFPIAHCRNVSALGRVSYND